MLWSPPLLVACFAWIGPEQFVNALTLGAIYALVALGYTMVYGIIELINFAHGDVFMVGTFVSLSFLTSLGFTGAVTDPLLLVVLLVGLFVVHDGGHGRHRRAHRALRLPAPAERTRGSRP